MTIKVIDIVMIMAAPAQESKGRRMTQHLEHLNCQDNSLSAFVAHIYNCPAISSVPAGTEETSCNVLHAPSVVQALHQETAKLCFCHSILNRESQMLGGGGGTGGRWFAEGP